MINKIAMLKEESFDLKKGKAELLNNLKEKEKKLQELSGSTKHKQESEKGKVSGAPGMGKPPKKPSK